MEGYSAGSATTESGPMNGPDARFIELCDRLILVRAAWAGIAAFDGDAPNRGRYHKTYTAMQREEDRIRGELVQTRLPTTADGIKAAARAAWELNDGYYINSESPPSSLNEWLLLTLAGSVAGISKPIPAPERP